MDLKLIHNIAKYSDYTTFEKIMIDEIGGSGILKLDGLLKKSSNIQETAKQLIKLACNHFEVSEQVLLSNSRKRKYIYMRTSLVMVLRNIFPDADRYIFGLIFSRDHMFLSYCEKRHEEHIGYEDYKLIYDKVRKL